MTVLATRSTPEGSRSADWLWIAAHSILASMPVVMAVASRASTLVLAVATAVTLAALLAEGRLRGWLAEAAAALASPLGLAVLAFLGFAALSTTWSAAPALSLATLVEFGAALAGAFIVGLVLPRRMPQRRPLMLAASLGIACAVILLQLWTDSAIRRAVALRADDFIYNRPTLTVLLLTIPLAWMLLRGGHRRVGWAVLAAAGATILISSSGASVLGASVALAAYGLARSFGRGAAIAVGAGLVLAIALAPATGSIAERVLPSSVHDGLAHANTRARVEIWTTFGEAVWQAPLLGGGFGVSPTLAQNRPVPAVPGSDPATVVLWHPHNAALQVWVELGAVGAALAIAVVVLLVRRIAALPSEMLAVSLALLAAVAAVSLVGHGAWQAWWPAAIGAAVVWLRAAREVLRGSDDSL
jgi:exopolysaccharide production protein ExoQ